MRKLNVLLFIGALALSSSCKKEEKEPTPPTPTPTAQTKTLPVYLGDPAMINYFGGNPPMVRFIETGNTNESTFLVNTCSNVNGNSFTVTYGKSYNVIFGIYIDGQWTQYGGFNGTMTVSSTGQISGQIGAGAQSVMAMKATDFGGCMTTIIQGDILLFN